MKNMSVQRAAAYDAEAVVAILHEAARWLEDTGRGMWREEEIAAESICREVEDGRFFLARVDDQAAGCFRLDEEDALFWPERPSGEALYLHRLAIRRLFAGQFAADFLLTAAKMVTCHRRRPFLRLDCELGREALYGLYARNGFSAHSEKWSPPYHVLRWECPVLPDRPLGL